MSSFARRAGLDGLAPLAVVQLRLLHRVRPLDALGDATRGLLDRAESLRVEALVRAANGLVQRLRSRKIPTKKGPLFCFIT